MGEVCFGGKRLEILLCLSMGSNQHTQTKLGEFGSWPLRGDFEPQRFGEGKQASASTLRGKWGPCQGRAQVVGAQRLLGGFSPSPLFPLLLLG